MGNAPGPPPYKKGTAAVSFLAATFLVLGLLFASGTPVTAEWAGFSMLIGVLAAATVVAGIFLRSQREGPQHGGDDPLHIVKRIEDQDRGSRMQCLNCGFANPGEAENCLSCGHSIVHVCKRCQTKVRLDWNTCPECGMAF